MTRVSKTPTPAKTAAAPATTAAAPAKKSSSKKKAASATPDVVVAPVENVVTETSAPEVAVLESVTKLQEFGAKIQQLTGIIAALKQDFKTLDKVVNREV